MLILKILRAPEWAELRRLGETDGAPVDRADGFIHFSTPAQAQETAAKHFAGEDDLVLLGALTAPLGDALKWEESRGGALFPHLYGELRLADIAFAWPLPLAGGMHVFPEEICGFIDPARAQFDTFKALGRDHPIEMLNLVRLRETADYPASHAFHGLGHSGAQAYAAYGAESGPVLSRVGGEIVWRGDFETMLIGPMTERWDHCFIARYPSAAAFLEMITDDAYRAAVVHRQAAVETSRLIRTRPTDPKGTFG